MKEMLCEECTSKEEIEDLDSIGDLKALCPDGMHAIFQKNGCCRGEGDRQSVD
jgi:hypothetical protein